MTYPLTTMGEMPNMTANEAITNSDLCLSSTQRESQDTPTTETSPLIIGERLPRMIFDVRYKMKSYNKATVIWNTVPKELELLNGNDLWMNRSYLKRTFKEPIGCLTKGNGVKFRIMKGATFPICLLLNCSILEDRLKVINWWISLSKIDRQKEWKNITKVFVRPTVSGKLLDLNGYVRHTPNRDHTGSAKNAARCVFTNGSKSIVESTMGTHGVGKTSSELQAATSSTFESNLGERQTPDLVASEEVIIQRLQQIYLEFADRGTDVEPSILWQHKEFQHGILLLRCIYENFSRIPLHDNTKVLLICQQVHSDKTRCHQFCIHNKLRLRYYVQPLCRPCQEQLDTNHETEYRNARRAIIVEDRYRKIQNKTYRQKRRIEILRERVKNKNNAQFDPGESDSGED
jgi:hypothetical protein